MRARFLALATTALAVGCGAPRAAPLGGDVGSAIQAGIDSGGAGFDHEPWNRLVRSYVRQNGRRFDYAGLKTEEAAFESYLRAIAEVDLATLSSAELQALLLNAYNAFTVKTVLDHVTEDGRYEIESIRDVPDVFGREVHPIGGFTLSLDNIEHNLLRPTFRDPRFHFAVNCASISCPPLPTEAFESERLDEQLDTFTRRALRNPDYVAVDGDGLLVTRIMDWYGGDFVDPDYQGSAATLAKFIAKYADGEVLELVTESEGDVPIRFRDYVWKLNRE